MATRIDPDEETLFPRYTPFALAFWTWTVQLGRAGWVECEKPKLTHRPLGGRSDPEARSHAQRCTERSKQRHEERKYKQQWERHLTNGYIPSHSEMDALFGDECLAE